MSALQASGSTLVNELPPVMDAETLEEYTSQSILLQKIAKIPSIDKAWVFKSDKENSSKAMFLLSQSNLLANKQRNFILSALLLKDGVSSLGLHMSPFPIEMNGISAVVPSPSGSKLLMVRNAESDSATVIEIWSGYQLEKEVHIPQSVHGSVYTDGWFEGISWNHEESSIAYVAEEPPQPKPEFDDLGYKNQGSSEKKDQTWKAQGFWEENWGETYAKKRRPSLFVLHIASKEVREVIGVPRSLSTGQVVWAPPAPDGDYLVFVGWSSDNGFQKAPRKLGIKYCYNRPCSLYAAPSPFSRPKDDTIASKEKVSIFELSTQSSSGFFPRFSPDGKVLVFLSASSAVDSGAHNATCSLHKIQWPADSKLEQLEITDVVSVVTCPPNGGFPGLYCSSMLCNPWLSDGNTMILSSAWGSSEVILSINTETHVVSRISPQASDNSWNVLSLDGDNILALSSSPVDPPQVFYGFETSQAQQPVWSWKDISDTLPLPSSEVKSLLLEHEFKILKIPVSNASEDLSEGAKLPIEAIFVSCKNSASSPTVVILHGGPHSVSLTSFSKSWAFLSSLGLNLLIVNYRGSLGFGEEALQSLPGKIGNQDVDDVLTALNYAIKERLVDGSKVVVLGGSHGGFLTTHLIGQAPEKFVAAAARNPVCNLALMVGTTDIPDWCYFEVYGKEGKKCFSESPSADDLSHFYKKSPISHISKVKTPLLLLQGAQDLRVPASNGLQYARVLRERGVEVKVILFPDDVHGIDKPQSDFESFVNIGVWFKKHLGA